MIKEIKKILKIIRFFLLYRKKHVDLKYEISYNDVIDIKSQVIKDKHIPKKFGCIGIHSIYLCIFKK